MKYKYIKLDNEATIIKKLLYVSNLVKCLSRSIEIKYVNIITLTNDIIDVTNNNLLFLFLFI